MTKYIILPASEKLGSANMKNELFKSTNIIITNNFIKDSNSVYLVVKTYSDKYGKIIKNLKKNNNKFIYYPIDFQWNCNKNKYIKKMNNIFINFDHVIFNSKQHQNFFNLKNSSIIHHEYDNRFKISKINVDFIQYIGLDIKCSIDQKTYDKFDIKVIDKNIFNSAQTGIHIDYLKNDNLYYYIHTSTKLSTALSLNSVFICNRLPIYEELLGPNYELYINDDLSNLKDIIKKSKQIISNEDKYNEYLTKTKNVKIQLSPSNILNKFIKLLDKFN